MTDAQRFDLVVMGGGIAGLTAANRAAQLGLKVVVLEKGEDERYACNSRYSGGILHIAFHNIKEPESDLLKVIETATGGQSVPELARAFAANAGRAVDWLREEGAKFIRVGSIVWQQYVLAPPRPITPGLDWKGRGPDVTLRALTDNLVKRGGRVQRGARVEELIVREGGCGGVVAACGGARQRFEAQAVVIADGGFQANLELVAKHIGPNPAGIKQRGAATGMGDGLRLAQGLGAASSDLRCFYGHMLSRDAFHNDMVWPYPQLDELGIAGMVVNATGRRVADEGIGGVYMANMIARQDDPLSCFALFDQAVWDGPGKAARIPANPNLVKAGGTVHRADTLADLAKVAGIDAAALAQTVAEYNAALAAGRSAALAVPRSIVPNAAMPVATAPFYAVPICAGITYTMGGLSIDADARVLRADGTPIAGLYAAGSATGGLEGGEMVGYLGGLMKATVFGLKAAEHAAQAAKR